MNGYNFTERVRKVLAMAREEAYGLKHEYVGTEHILLAILSEGEGVANTVLQNLDVNPDALRSTILGVVKVGVRGPVAGPDLPYTSRAKKVLELAMSEARELDHSYVDTEHLLLGLMREGKGIAAQVLTDAGAKLENSRAETLRILSRLPPDQQELRRPVMNGYNFTERVRTVLALARTEAVALGHPYIGTEHILLGILSEGEGVASTVLQNVGVELELLRSDVISAVKIGTAQNVGPDLPYTSRAKKVLELAMTEAREIHHSYVGTEHLLLGLIREEKGIAAQTLKHAGVTLENARAEVHRILGTAMDRTAANEPAIVTTTHVVGMTSRAAARVWGRYTGTVDAHLPKSARRVREIIGAAHDVAVERRSPVIAPAHLAIALLRHEGGIANAALDRLGFDRAAVLQALSELAPAGPEPVDPEGVVTAAPELVTAIEAMEALRHEANAVNAGSHHLLLALLMTCPDVDAAFSGQDVDTSRLRDAIRWISG